MGLLGKLVGVGAGIIGRNIENAFEKQEQRNIEYLLRYPYTHKYLIREVKHTMDDMNHAKEVGVEGDFFTVFNVSN